METNINILESFQAMQNCIKANVVKKNADGELWENLHWDKVESTLLAVLPSGSGINCKWEFDYTANMIYCRNTFHNMNDDGYYMGYTDFTVRIKTNHRCIDKNLDFIITGKFGKDQALKDYLWETIDHALDTL